MYKHLNGISSGLVMALIVSTVGCGQGMKSSTSSSLGSASAVVEDASAQIKKAEAANVEAQNAMAEAETVLKSIQDDNGNINVSLFQSSSSEVSTSGLLSPLVDKLRTAFDTVFAKVALVKQKFTEARQALAVALAKLDANDPTQATLIAEIKKQMAAIDTMEAQFRSSLLQLSGKLDLALNALEKVISGVTSFIPGWGWLINLGLDYLVMGDIRDLVAEIKLKLISI